MIQTIFFFIVLERLVSWEHYVVNAFSTICLSTLGCLIGLLEGLRILCFDAHSVNCGGGL